MEDLMHRKLHYASLILGFLLFTNLWKLVECISLWSKKQAYTRVFALGPILDSYFQTTKNVTILTYLDIMGNAVMCKCANVNEYN